MTNETLTGQQTLFEYMEAAMYYGAEDVRVEEIDEQSLDPDAVRVDVAAAGICGSDLHEYAAGPMAIPDDSPHPVTGETLPVPMGHEFSGTISETGEDVTDLEVGDAVAVNPGIWCGECQYCRNGEYHLCEFGGFVGLSGNGGGFAESVTVPAITAVRLPESIPVELGAVVEPLSVATYAVRNSGMQAGDSVAVFGSGPIGLGVVQAAQAAGASNLFVSEPQDVRAEMASEAGGDTVLDPMEMDVVEHIVDETNGGVDAAFEVAGVEQTFNDAIASTKRGGNTTIVSLFEESVEMNPTNLVITQKTLGGSLGYPCGPISDESFGRTIDLIDNGHLDPELLVTSQISLDDIVDDGFDRLLNNQDQVKILVEP